ncbi:MAG: hypothetical protein AAFR52_13250 [Pseudomonadota bacterium]
MDDGAAADQGIATFAIPLSPEGLAMRVIAAFTILSVIANIPGLLRERRGEGPGSGGEAIAPLRSGALPPMTRRPSRHPRGARSAVRLAVRVMRPLPGARRHASRQHGH